MKVQLGFNFQVVGWKDFKGKALFWVWENKSACNENFPYLNFFFKRRM